MYKQTLCLAFAMLFLAAPALAMDHSKMDHSGHGNAGAMKEALKGKNLDEAYAGADANGDGIMDMPEFHKAFPQFSHEEFMAMDQDKDYKLTKDEWHAGMGGH